ncbi:hypothetical protein [Comamonas fluminis]|uniref:hypothetical protein n=1 Tax=Comamonas fluminis TaxID=2796366 RepID=UPI001C4780D0|nr:hypothetical protein [Comamonas fluminis]
MSELPEFEISAAHALVRLQATLAYVDAEQEPSRIALYDANEQLLVTLTLTKPCGQITADGSLLLTQANGGGDMIISSGQASIGIWSTSDGKLIGRGLVTDEAGQGHFKLLGSTGTQLYAGGKAILGETRIY